MIASVRGTLIHKDNAAAVVECGGVGLRLFVTKNTLYRLPETGTEVFLYTHLAVKEDALDLLSVRLCPQRGRAAGGMPGLPSAGVQVQ